MKPSSDHPCNKPYIQTVWVQRVCNGAHVVEHVKGLDCSAARWGKVNDSSKKRSLIKGFSPAQILPKVSLIWFMHVRYLSWKPRNSSEAWTRWMLVTISCARVLVQVLPCLALLYFRRLAVLLHRMGFELRCCLPYIASFCWWADGWVVCRAVQVSAPEGLYRFCCHHTNLRIFYADFNHELLQNLFWYCVFSTINTNLSIITKIMKVNKGRKNNCIK